jgi:hypothetical protein
MSIEAIILGKENSPARRDGMPCDVVIIRGAVPEDELDIFRQRAKDGEQNGNFVTIQEDGGRKMLSLDRNTKAKQTLEMCSIRIIQVMGLNRAYKMCKPSLLRTDAGASDQEKHTGKQTGWQQG